MLWLFCLRSIHLTMYMFLRPQEQVVSGERGVLTVKSVKRTDSGNYKCTAMDFENLEADLSGTIALTVNCE